jgi:hypothetical protein
MTKHANSVLHETLNIKCPKMALSIVIGKGNIYSANFCTWVTFPLRYKKNSHLVWLFHYNSCNPTNYTKKGLFSLLYASCSADFYRTQSFLSLLSQFFFIYVFVWSLRVFWASDAFDSQLEYLHFQNWYIRERNI